jgi:hypothetical protein
MLSAVHMPQLRIFFTLDICDRVTRTYEIIQ